MRRISLLVLMILSSLNVLCQATNEVEMADILRRDGKIYTVVIGLALILTGMIFFLLRVDRKINKLEKEFKDKES